MDETWDGSPEVDVPFPCRSFYRAYVNSKKEENKPEDDAVLSHTGSETNNEDGKGIARRMTRKEARQLDREIPWRDILEMNDKTRAEYIKAIQKEEASWFAWNGVTPVDDAAAEAIFRDPARRKRILKSRCAYRDKSKGAGALQAKARVVAVGCSDPDLFQLNRDSPTPTRLSEYLILNIYCSGRNGMVGSTRCRFKLWSGDVRTAFLQGEQDSNESEEDLYMAPPRDLIEEAGAYPHRLYKITGNVYGLANSPRLWARVIIRRMTRAHFRQAPIEHIFDLLDVIQVLVVAH